MKKIILKNGVMLIVSSFLLLALISCKVKENPEPEASKLIDSPLLNQTFYIGTWGVNPCPTKESTDIEYKLVADAGINLIWSEAYHTYSDSINDYKFKLSEKLGLKHIIPLWVQPQATPEALEADTKRWKAWVEKYKNYPAVIGFDMRDEPPFNDLPLLYDAREYIESVIPAGKFAICNLHPSWQIDPVYTGPKGYEHYLSTYMQGVKPKLLSFDNYPIRFSEGEQANAIAELINNLVLIRFEALKANIPFNGFIQAVEWPNNRLPNQNEMRFLNNLHIVFGADAISYFIWADLEYYTGEPVNPQHVPNERYDMIKELNGEINAFSTIFTPFKQDGVITKNLPDNFLKKIPENLRKESYGNLKSIETTGKLINGCFDLQGQKAVYLFNFDYANSTSAEIMLDGTVNFELWGKGGLEKPGKGSSLSVSLQPGEGKFLVFEK